MLISHISVRPQSHVRGRTRMQRNMKLRTQMAGHERVLLQLSIAHCEYLLSVLILESTNHSAICITRNITHSFRTEVF